MKKKGANHIEIILAFIIFAGTVFFVVYLLNPFESKFVSQNDMDNTYKSVFDYVSIKAWRYSFSVDINSLDGNNNNNNNGNNPYSFLLGETFDSNNFGILAVDKNGDSISAGWHVVSGPPRVCFRPKKQGNELTLTYVYVGEGLKTSSQGAGCGAGSEANQNYYKTISPIKMDIVSEEKITNLATDYDNAGYDVVKRNLGLPANRDFSFSLSYPGKSISPTKQILTANNTEVVSITKRVLIVTAQQNNNQGNNDNNNGQGNDDNEGQKIVYGDLNVKIW